jgi:hypothetical protein
MKSVMKTLARKEGIVFVHRMLLMVCLAFPLKALSADKDYFRRSKGDVRVFEFVTTLPDGTRHNETIHTTITEAVERDGHTYLREKWESSDSVTIRTILCRIDDDGGYTIFESSHDREEHKTMVFPLKVGSHWSFTMGEQVHTSSIVGYETVTVENVTYPNCLHVHLDRYDGHPMDVWYDRNIGFVKSTGSNSKGEPTSLTLKEFKPGS